MNAWGVRLSAVAIAFATWSGLAIDLAVAAHKDGGFVAALYSELAFFTIITNFATATIFTGLAAGVRAFAAPRLLAGVALSIMLVGVVYWTLLRVPGLTGAALASNVLLHAVGPIVVPLFWLAFAHKGKLRFRDPLVWSVYPLVYAVYALVRGGITGVYPYFFIDVPKIGWGAALFNAAAIAVGFFAAGALVVALDARLSRTRG